MEDTQKETDSEDLKPEPTSELLKRLDLYNRRRQSLHPGQRRRLSGLEESCIEIPMLLDGWKIKWLLTLRFAVANLVHERFLKIFTYM